MILRDLGPAAGDARLQREERGKERKKKKKKKKKSEAEEEEEEDEEDEQQRRSNWRLRFAPQPVDRGAWVLHWMQTSSTYFGSAPSVKFPGRTFPVTELYLEPPSRRRATA